MALRATGGARGVVAIELLGSNLAIGRPSSGSIANNGALTLTTALQTTYSQGAYMYFPANSIAAGVAAGLYWVVMSSTTLGTIYNNTYTSGTPTAPTSLTPFVTTGPGAYTQTVGEVTLLLGTMPGGSMGKNGVLEVGLLALCNNSAGTKSVSFKIDSVTYLTSTLSTVQYSWIIRSVMNCNSEAIQVSQSLGASTYVSSASAPIRSTLNTAVDQSLFVTLACNTATDFAFLEQYNINVTQRTV